MRKDERPQRSPLNLPRVASHTGRTLPIALHSDPAGAAADRPGDGRELPSGAVRQPVQTVAVLLGGTRPCRRRDLGCARAPLGHAGQRTGGDLCIKAHRADHSA